MVTTVSEFEHEKWDKDLLQLSGLLAETLFELGRPDLATVVPWIESREPKENLSTEQVQVYSLAFQLLNMVEENTANQAKRYAESLNIKKHSWQNVIERFESRESFWKAFQTVSVQPTLTAHPTESKRATVLDHFRKLYLLLLRLENNMYSSNEREWTLREIKASLERLLRTGEVNIVRPDVHSELGNVVYYLSEVFPAVVKILVQRFVQQWELAGGSLDELTGEPIIPSLVFGNWVGGDRDGHPKVTSEVTQETLMKLRQAALHLQRAAIAELASQLSLDEDDQPITGELKQRMSELAETDRMAAEAALRRNPGEPYRQFLSMVLHRIPQHANELPKNRYKSKEELLQDLKLLFEHLVASGADRLAIQDVLPVIQLVHTFGFHLARLDIRQNSRVFHTALGQLMNAAGVTSDWANLDNAARASIFKAELSQSRPFVNASQCVGEEADEVRKLFRVLAEHVRNFGEEGIGTIIVSMTHSAQDLLAVWLLAREGELAQTHNGSLSCPIPVVPLFETIEDLNKSKAVMTEYANFLKQRPVPSRGPSQDIMIGYSDSNKDGGIIASFWGLHQAQSDLTRLSDELALPFRFFHGRGGTIIRGAGPTDRFLAAQPYGALKHGLKMTEQGETINQKYANKGTAASNLEQLLVSTMQAQVPVDSSAPFTELSAVLDSLAKWSCDNYQSLLDEPDFVPFFRQVTPVDVIEQSKIGSRPTRRTGASTLEDLRAIPWVFAWNQSRFFLSGWYGAGSAISKLKLEQPDQWSLLARWCREWAPTNYLFLNIETMLYSASSEIMKLYGSLVTDADLRSRFLPKVIAEYELCRRVVDELLDGEFRMRRPKMAKTLSLREPPLADLHRTQVRMLQDWRKSNEESLLNPLLMVTNAIAGGLRTTG